MRLIHAITATLIITATITAQQPCDHTSNSKARFDAMRITPPSKVYSDGVNLTVNYQDKVGIYTLQLLIDKNTALPKLNKNRYYFALYDSCANYAYTIVEVTPEQFK